MQVYFRTLIIQYQISRAFTSFFPLKGYKVNEKWDDDYSEDITTSDDNNVNGDNDASGGANADYDNKPNEEIPCGRLEVSSFGN